jgi:hypothetical protein
MIATHEKFIGLYYVDPHRAPHEVSCTPQHFVQIGHGRAIRALDLQTAPRESGRGVYEQAGPTGGRCLGWVARGRFVRCVPVIKDAFSRREYGTAAGQAAWGWAQDRAEKALIAAGVVQATP